jgi:hypothetical protein
MSLRSYVLGGALAAVVCHTAPAAAEQPRDYRLNVIFRVKPSSGSGGMKEIFPAALVFRKGAISGTVEVKDSNGKFPCAVQSGSTDVGYKLNMTCSVQGGVDIVTFTGKLNLLTGNGRGTVSDTFLHETGTYIASKVVKP